MATTWKVTGQLSNQFGSDGSGTPVQGHVISFTTGDGWRDSVFVPDDHYNAHNVTAAIHAKAQIADAVGKLEFTG